MNWASIQILGFGLLIILSGFFSSTEVAYTGLSYSQLKRIHRLRPRFLNLWEKSPDRVLAVLLISNNAVNIGVGVLAGSVSISLSQIIGWKESILTFIIGFTSGFILLVFGEILPKIWARQNTVSWALSVTPLMNSWIQIVSPIARAAVWVTNKILFRGKKRSRTTPFLRESELKTILTHSAIPTPSRKILNNLIDFSRSMVRDVMVPRSDIVAFSIKEPLNHIIERVIQSGLSRIPIYSGSLDNIIGVLHSKDLLVAWRNGSLVVLEDLLRPVLVVQENQYLSDVMRVFKSGQHHLALVREIGEKTRITGLVSLENALEAIVGEIKEEL